MSASVNLPLHHKIQKFSSGTSSPGWSQRKARPIFEQVKQGSVDVQNDVSAN